MQVGATRSSLEVASGGALASGERTREYRASSWSRHRGCLSFGREIPNPRSEEPSAIEVAIKWRSTAVVSWPGVAFCSGCDKRFCPRHSPVHASTYLE
jgi:hypothetical protein